MDCIRKCLYILLLFHLRRIAGQECDSDENTSQCSTGKICLDKVCTAVIDCSGGSAECSATPGIYCISDYCQPDPCTTTGECVYGQVCSQESRCVFPVIVNATEKLEFTLKFEEPAASGTYEKIDWYKGSRNGKIVFFDEGITGDNPKYFNDYCSGNVSSCDSSDKGELNIKTGVLTIKTVELSDEGFYYYKFFVDNVSPDTGTKYEYKLNVYVTGDLKIEGISDTIVEVGTELPLTCTIDRIKPEAVEMYWEVNGRNERGSVETTTPDPNGVLSQTNTFTYKVAQEDEGKAIKCIVDPMYGDKVVAQQIVNPGYGPTGKPELTPPHTEAYEGKRVTLTCKSPTEAGNPNCNEFTFTMVELRTIRNTSGPYTFNMDESYEGNYTCKCGNGFGTSDVSNIVGVVLQAGTPPAKSGGVNMAVIGGAIGGVVFIGLIIVIVVFIMRRRNKPKAVPDDDPRTAQTNGALAPEPVYAQPDKSKRKLRPQRGLNEGVQYVNTKELQGENPYENTKVDNNNPPGKQENGVMPPEVVYSEVNVGENGVQAKSGKNANKPKPKERSSVKKPKINQNEEPTVYAEIKPQQPPQA